MLSVVKNETSALSKKMKKTFISLTVSCFGLSFFASAETTNNLPTHSANVEPLPACYNEDASYRLENGIDCFATADYLYWQWSQGLLQVGTLTTPIDSDYTVGNARAVLQAPGYSSGFRTGLGCKLKEVDNWNLFAEYTWYLNVSKDSFSTPSDSALVLPGAFFRRDQQSLSQYHYKGSIFSKARLGFQSLDLLLQKNFYLGKKLTTTISSGLRAQWISNELEKEIEAKIVELSASGTTKTNTLIKQTTWALGPKLSLNLNYLLGHGIKFISQMAMSCVYTQYNAYNTYKNPKEGVSFKETTLHNSGSIKPVGEAFLGLGWGSYFQKDRIHMDLSLGYDFDIYWNYILAAAPITQSVANLQLQGLRASIRFDF